MGNTARNSEPSGMFGGSVATNVVTSIAQFFRKFRFRKLSCRYSGLCSTSQVGNVLINYEPQASQTSQIQNTALQQSHVMSNRSMRFPPWVSQVDVPLISERKSGPSDELWNNMVADISLTTVTDATKNTYAQGLVEFLTHTDAWTTTVLLGKYEWEFVLDLYGMMPYQGETTPLLSRPSREPRPQAPESKQDKPLQESKAEPATPASSPTAPVVQSLPPSKEAKPSDLTPAGETPRVSGLSSSVPDLRAGKRWTLI